MAGIQTDNLLLLDLTTGLPRTSETGGTPDIIQSSVDWEFISGANVLVDGNLIVNGTTTTVHSEQVNLRDNHLYLNADYTVVAAQTGGIVVNVLPTATTDTVAAAGFTAGVLAVSNPTVITVGLATFTAGDIIQISGANNQDNDGLFEVDSHIGTTLTIRGIGTTATTQDWFHNQFTTDATVGGAITLVNVNVLRGNSSGDWETFTGNSSTGLVYATLMQQGAITLQDAYEAGNTISITAAEGILSFSNSTDVTNVLKISRTFAGAGVGIDLNMGAGTTGIGIDVDSASSGNAVDITATGVGDALFINNTGTGAALTVQDGGGDVLDISAAGAVTITPTSGQDATITVAGAGVLNLDAGAGGVTVDAVGGGISIDSDTASNFSVTGANLVLSTITTGTVEVTSANDIQMTFATNNATAMVIDDGVSNFVTFDSTTNDLAVEVNQFLDIVGNGAGVTLTAGTTIAVGELVSLNSAGDVILADANTGTDGDGYCIGVAATAATSTNPVRIYSMTGSKVPVSFAVAPGATTNGSIVFVSNTAGQGTLTPPAGSAVVYKIGILQGADGLTLTPDVIFQPQYVAKKLS